MFLPQLCIATHGFARHAFRPVTAKHHLRQAQMFMDFCNHYHLHFLLPAIPVVCYYITHLTTHFVFAASIHNYILGMRLLHTHLTLNPK